MYEQFYGLREKPFALLPDAEFLYLSSRHRRALSLLDYGIAARAGFVVITGEVGTGKTTILRRFLRKTDASLTVGLVTNASAAHQGMLDWVSTAFDLAHQGRDHITLYNQFVDFLIAQYSAGKRTVLVVDEAQNLTVQMLEDLRMLSNVNNEKDALLQIVLVGQPELLETLNRQELRQFAQRISVHYHLQPLGAAETVAYIRHRLSVVGGAPTLFDDQACAAIHYFSGGVPRLTNLLCDLALTYAFADEANPVSIDTVIDVVMDRNQSGLTAFRPIPGALDRDGIKALISQSSQN